MSTNAPPKPPQTTPPGSDDTSSRGPLLLKVGLPLVVVIALVVIDPGASRAIVQATASSPQALLIIAGIVAATVGWSALLRRYVPNEWAQAVLVLLPIAIIGAIYITPYYTEGETVDDEFPVAVAPADPTAEETAPATEPPTEPTAEVEQPAAEEEAEQPEPAEGQEQDGSGQAGQAAPEATPPAEPAEATEPAEAPQPAEPAQPVELSRGTFVGLDGHFANGQAAVYDLGDGSQLVRLEEVDLQNVPEPYVYVVPTLDATAPTEGSVNLGPLKGTQGNQNYEVPADVDLSTGEWTVLVWCEPFASPVGAASQG